MPLKFLFKLLFRAAALWENLSVHTPRGRSANRGRGRGRVPLSLSLFSSSLSSLGLLVGLPGWLVLVPPQRRQQQQQLKPETRICQCLPKEETERKDEDSSSPSLREKARTVLPRDGKHCRVVDAVGKIKRCARLQFGKGPRRTYFIQDAEY